MTRAPAKSDLSAELVRSLLSYDPNTGILKWRARRGGKAAAGSVAGTDKGDGYIGIMINGRTYLAHRLAWLFSYGVWPSGLLDHRDGDKSNNVLANLREVSRSQNNINSVRKGCHFNPGRPSPKKYRAAIGTSGHSDFRVIGWYHTAHEAMAAYEAASIERHGEFSVFNRRAA
jgi:hypothetical protein